MQHELLKWYDVITKQNYFTNNQDIVIQHDGLAMGAPSSGITAEIFLQHTEHTHLTHLTQKHNIVNYFPYVDDILLIFDPIHTDIQAILRDFNALHPNLQFTAEIERDNTLNYLDISIHKTPNNIKTSIHRKSTFTDSNISYRSNHPIQHKYKFTLTGVYKFTLTGVYKLSCPDCNKAFVGQTGRRFSIRYNEHNKAFYNNSHTSNFAQHLHEI